MKKLMIGVLSLAFASCMTAAISLTSNNASAQETQNTSIFTETKCQISKSGDKMLMVTGITDVSRVYEVGYDISGGYQLSPNDIAETNMYYESLTLGTTTKTAGEFLAGAQGLLIWEVAYNSAYSYTVQPYAYLGEFNNAGQLIAPENETKSYGAVKANFNQVMVTFAYEDGTVIDTQSVNIGAKATSIAAPEKANAEFVGWYVDGVEYNFEQKVTKNMTVTAKYNEAATYAVKVTTAQYNVKYDNGYYYANALSYVDATSDFASYLGINANGVGAAMSGTTIDLTEAVKNLPEGVKLNNESVLKGVVEEDGSLELNVKLDFDEDYLGFKLSQVCLGQWGSCDNALLTLAVKGGVVGLAIDSNINNGSGVYIDIDDVNKAENPYLLLTFYEQNNVSTLIEVADAAGTWTTGNQDIIYTQLPVADNYYATTINVFDKFPNHTTVSNLKIKAGGGGVKNMFIVGLKATDKEAFKKNEVWNMTNGKLEGKVLPLTVGSTTTMSQETHTFTAGTMDAIVYKYPGKEPGNKYMNTGVRLDLGGAINVNNYASINVVFRTNAYAIGDPNYADGTNNSGTILHINGKEINTYYGNDNHKGHTIDLISLAKGKGIDTIYTVELIHSRWGNRNNITMYIGSISFRLATGVAEDDKPTTTVAQTVTYSADNGNILDIATPMGNYALTTESNYEVGGVLYNNLCYRRTDVLSAPGEFPGERAAGVKFNLGSVKVSDYETVKIKFRASALNAAGNNNTGVIVWINDIKVYTDYAGPKEVDLKALAEANGIKYIETVEISNSSWADMANYNVFVSWIQLVAAQ